MGAKASLPSRKTASVTIGWGLVSIPVGLYAATSENRVSFKEFCADGHPVGRKMYDKETGEDVDRGEIYKMFQTPDGEWVRIDPEEVEAVLQTSKGTASIVQFRPLNEWFDGQFFYTNVYQIRPDKMGSGRNKTDNPAANKAFTLLMEAMAVKRVYGLVEVALRGKTYMAALTPDGRFYLLFFDDEVRQDLPAPEVDISEAELDMATKLIDTNMAVDGEVELVNHDYEKIVEFAVEKAKKGGKVDLPEPKPAQSSDDLMAVLQASLEQ